MQAVGTPNAVVLYNTSWLGVEYLPLRPVKYALKVPKLFSVRWPKLISIKV